MRAVGCDHPAIRGAVIAFVTERSCRWRAWLLLLGDCRSSIGDLGEQGADVCFERWVLAPEWIGASDGAACGPRNSAPATPRRPALLIAESEARGLIRTMADLHMQIATAAPLARRPLLLPG